MIRGETVLSGGQHPGTPLEVLHSAGGYYLGFLTKTGAPYSRESRYFQTKKGAEAILGAMRH